MEKKLPWCKLCKLYYQDPGLWEEIHKRVLHLGQPQTEVARWAETYIDKLNMHRDEFDKDYIITLSAPNFYNHFSKHITSTKEMDKVLAQKEIPTIQDREYDKVISKLTALEPVGEAVDDYQSLCRLVTAAERRLSVYEEEHFNQKPRAGKKAPPPIDLDEIQLFQKLVKELMAMKKELTIFQMRYAVAGEALRETIELIVAHTMAQLKDALIEMRTNVARELPGSSLPDQMQALVLNTMGEYLKAVVPEILTSVYKRYKIK